MDGATNHPDHDQVDLEPIDPTEPDLPLALIASPRDLRHARDLLLSHQPFAVVSRVCLVCGEQWPCTDFLFGRAITGAGGSTSD